MKTWQAILEPARGRAILDAIAEALRTPPPVYEAKLEDAALPLALLAREPGFAVFLGYLDRARADPALQASAARHLATAVAVLPAAIEARRPYFSFGFAGLGWAIEHMNGWVVEVEDDALDDIDDTLLHLVAEDAVDHHGLYRGLVGYALYALERLPRPGARELLARVVARLVAVAEPCGEGCSWRVRPGQLLPEDRARHPDGVWLPGVVDGAAGPIAILGAAARLGIGGEPARATLEAAHRALWSAGSADRGAQVSPTSWGGGDIGIAAVLAATQQGAPRVRAIERAHAIARRADPAAATDPSLVRGTAGVAHALNRLFQATGDRVFGDAARAWFERTIALFDPARGLGGYRFWQAPWQNAYIPELSTGWVDAPGLIGGIAGVGLALLAACEPIEPAWDRVLLLSTREAA